MSIARAVTQLIKTRVNVSAKISALEEEKQGVLGAVMSKYINKESDLNSRLSEANGALKALGYNEAQIEELSNKYLKGNDIDSTVADSEEE